MKDAIIVRASDPDARGFHAKDPLVDQVRLVGPSAGIILDVGAHEGEMTQRYLELFPAAVIHCFEPFPESHRFLAGRFQNLSRVTTHSLAVADSAGTRRLHAFTYSVTNSLLPKAPGAERYEDHGNMDERDAVEVTATSIDDFCGEEGIGHVDILKLDIQGGELLALTGAARMLASHAIGLIFTEVNFVRSYEGQAWFDDVGAYLRGHDYHVYDFYNFRYLESGQLKWGDAIFLPSKFRAG